MLSALQNANHHEHELAFHPSFLCPPRRMACVGRIVFCGRRGEHPLAHVPSIGVGAGKFQSHGVAIGAGVTASAHLSDFLLRMAKARLCHLASTTNRFLTLIQNYSPAHPPCWPPAEPSGSAFLLASRLQASRIEFDHFASLICRRYARRSCNARPVTPRQHAARCRFPSSSSVAQRIATSSAARPISFASAFRLWRGVPAGSVGVNPDHRRRCARFRSDPRDQRPGALWCGDVLAAALCCQSGAIIADGLSFSLGHCYHREILGFLLAVEPLLRSVDREVVGRNISERKNSPEIDRDRSSRPYPAQGKAESQAASKRAVCDAPGVRTASMQPKGSI